MTSSRHLVSLFSLLLLGQQTLHAAPPTVSHLFPAGGQRGTKVVVTCTGSFTWPTKVWAPGLDVLPLKESGKLEVTVPKNLAADRVWIRLYNAEGTAEPAPFLIGNLKEIEEKEPNDTPRQAQVIAEPSVTINGALSRGGDVDCFAVALKAGQTLVAAVDAHSRLGSPMDGILQITSAEGNVLAENNDDVGLDPRLAFSAVKDGTYIVRLFAFPAVADATIGFAGGPNFIYRLTLTTGPFVSHAVPLSVPRVGTKDVELFGWNLPPQAKAAVVPFGAPKHADEQEVDAFEDLRPSPDARLGFAFEPAFAGSARVRLVPHAVVPGLAVTRAQKPLTLTVPTSVTGRLSAPRQSDTYRVPLKKGQQIVITAEANTLHFPVDPVVRLADPDGGVVAEIDDTGSTRDAAFTHTAAKDGDYRLSIADRFRHGSDRHVYRLTVRFEEPDFELSATASAVVVTPGKPSELQVKLQRHGGLAAPITIQAMGLPKGIEAPAVVADAKAAMVQLKFSTDGNPFAGPIRIVGKAQALERVAHTPARLGASSGTVWLTAVQKK